jgi:hypothetical protein
MEVPVKRRAVAGRRSCSSTFARHKALLDRMTQEAKLSDAIRDEPRGRVARLRRCLQGDEEGLAMPSLKDIRKRIGSVKNTQQITKAMKMVAAARAA